MKKQKNEIAVVGGGAAGMMSAISAASGGAGVTIFEKNSAMGVKLSITGKGRCNITNNCSVDEVMANVTGNGKFLYSALRGFSPADTMRFFEDHGLTLKTERGNRVFPISDKARDVVSTLENALWENAVDIVRTKVSGLIIEDGMIKGIRTGAGNISCRAAIICTGGLSYPKTGSSGDGYVFAKQAGHKVTETSPSLVPFVSRDEFCGDMQGLSLKNVAVTLEDSNGTELYSDFGEMQFTHFGVSGPVILSASAHIGRKTGENYVLAIDLKPALDERILYDRITRDLEKHPNRAFKNTLDELAPRLLIPVLVERSGIPAETKSNSVTREQKTALMRLFKRFDVRIKGTRPISEAVITSGGVELNEIKPATMESKFVHGLYFAGEVLDLDAYTGGFNLQIAWSTAYAAGKAAAGQIRDED